MYFVYILKNRNNGSTYVGITKDLIKRFKEHNYKKPYQIVWYSVFSDKIKAYRFEKYLKTGSGIAFLRKHLI